MIRESGREDNMTTAQIEKAKSTWPSLSGSLYMPHSEEEYKELVSMLDNLIDEVGEDEDHALASLMEVIGVLIEKYEDDNVQELSA